MRARRENIFPRWRQSHCGSWRCLQLPNFGLHPTK